MLLDGSVRFITSPVKLLCSQWVYHKFYNSPVSILLADGAKDTNRLEAPNKILKMMRSSQIFHSTVNTVQVYGETFV